MPLSNFICEVPHPTPISIVINFRWFLPPFRMQRPSFTVIVSGIFLAYIAHSIYTIYGLFYPETCKVKNKCLEPFLAKKPNLEVCFNNLKIIKWSWQSVTVAIKIYIYLEMELVIAFVSDLWIPRGKSCFTFNVCSFNRYSRISQIDSLLFYACDNHKLIFIPVFSCGFTHP